MDPLLTLPAGSRGSLPAGGGAPAGPAPLRVVWERAADLAVEIFRLGDGPGAGDPALRVALRSAALVVPTCLARALGRGGREARGQMIVALGALAEIESHLALAARLSDAPLDGAERLRGRIGIVRRLIVALGARGTGPAAPAPQRRPP